VNKNKLQEEIGYRFNNEKLIEQALTHSSYTREKNLPRAECNERLEFLGDAFFDAIIGEELYNRLPTKKEGYLTKYRALVVCEASLAQVGRKLEIGELLKLGKGENQSGGRNRESVIADAMEAIIGAIYKDGGYETVRELVLKLFDQRIDDAVNGRLHSDYKSEFQERMQSKGPAEIQYVLMDEQGPDHAKIFYIKVLVDDVAYGEGTGHSKKEAEQQAAKEAILNWGKYVL